MSKYRKPFLKLLRPQWEKRFPKWKPSVVPPCFWARLDCTFSDDTAFETFGRYVHTVINFSPKRPGAFTADILITPSAEGFPGNCAPPPRWGEHIPALSEGSYRIGHFFQGKDHWWHLVDEAAMSKLFWESIPNLPVPPPVLSRKTHDWYASSYDQPTTEIMAEAANHFCDVFEHHVIPKLHRAK